MKSLLTPSGRLTPARAILIAASDPKKRWFVIFISFLPETRYAYIRDLNRKVGRPFGPKSGSACC